MKYRKYPLEIDAIQYKGGVQSADKVIAWAIENGVGPGMRYLGLGQSLAFGGVIDVPTVAGTVTASAGDWIIRGVAGEFYPCKPHILEATYEPVEEAPHQHVFLAPNCACNTAPCMHNAQCLCGEYEQRYVSDAAQ